MASAGDSKHTRIQVKHVFVAVIVIVSTLSFIASIVMLTIGYLNPFGMVGLGILGGGCVLYFATLLFLCSASIWVKNKYYAEENDFAEKGTRPPSEDIALLKPAFNVTSPAKNEARSINETECQLDNKMVPLCSASTVYSSVSSTASTVPDRTVLFNWQGGNAEKALDYDVFSTSPTAMQHTDVKLQENLKCKLGSREQITFDTASEWKIKDLERRKIADVPLLYNNGKSVSDTPCQRKPVVMDFVGTTYSSAAEKRLMNPHISGQSKEGNKNDMSAMLYPVKGPPKSAAQTKHQHIPELSKHSYESKGMEKYSQEYKPALEKRKIPTGEKDNQTPRRHWSIISADDSWIHNPRVQDTSNVLDTVPTGISETDKKHRSCERLDNIAKKRTEKPKAKDQPEKV